MASIQELVTLNDSGHLGDLLAESFKGKCRRFLQRCLDAEFMVDFGDLIPSAKVVHDLVVSHYNDLGYLVEEVRVGKESFEASIFSPTGDGGSLRVFINTNYPMSMGNGRGMRVTTNWT